MQDEVARRAEEQASSKAADLRKVQEEMEAAKRAQAEHWEKAKSYGDTAKQMTEDQATHEMKNLEVSKERTVSKEESSQGVPPALADITQPAGEGTTKATGARPAETGATDLSKTVPKRPHETSAAGVKLPVEKVRW